MKQQTPTEGQYLSIFERIEVFVRSPVICSFSESAEVY